MKKDLTEIVFILDRSGSMSGLEADPIGTELNFRVLSKAVANVRSGCALEDNWAAELEQHHKGGRK